MRQTSSLPERERGLSSRGGATSCETHIVITAWVSVKQIKRAYDYHDQKAPVSLDAEFAAIIEESGFLVARQPDLTDYLTQYLCRASAGVESFLYWSKSCICTDHAWMCSVDSSVDWCEG